MRIFSIIDAAQRSPEWFAARAGRLTGSRACDAVDFLKSGKESAKRRDYRYQLLAERLSGRPEDSTYLNAEMQRGIEKEPDARTAYGLLKGYEVAQTGFLSVDALMAGCSLDGHVGDFEGIVEIKCPKTATHCRYLREGLSKDDDHLLQITHNLWITGAQWCDFVSFDDRLSENMRLYVKRVQRGDVDIFGYEKAALQFLEDVDREVSSMRGWSVMGAA